MISSIKIAAQKRALIRSPYKSAHKRAARFFPRSVSHSVR